MCVVSMIGGHFQDMYPKPEMFPPKQYPDYQDLMRKAALYDEMMKQKDCPAPEKVQWQKDLEKFMQDKYGLQPKE